MPKQTPIEKAAQYVIPANLASRPVTIIGAGTLGRRIALMFSTRGGQVRIFDLSKDQRLAAVNFIRQDFPALLATMDGGIAGEGSQTDDLAQTVKNCWVVNEDLSER